MAPTLSNRLARGLTLLELLIALSILASLTAGVGVFWSQARAWEADNARHRTSLRLDRVLRTVRAQWDARRELCGACEMPGADVTAGEDGIAFTTAEPLLFPGWSLVRVRYSVERDLDGSWTLVYEEARILDPTAPPEPGTLALDPRGRRIGASITMLEGLAALRVERWGTRDGTPATSMVSAESERADDRDSGQDAPLDESDPDRVERWRTLEVMTESYPPRAYRVVGEREGEVFACVLVAAPSR